MRRYFRVLSGPAASVSDTSATRQALTGNGRFGSIVLKNSLLEGVVLS